MANRLWQIGIWQTGIWRNVVFPQETGALNTNRYQENFLTDLKVVNKNRGENKSGNENLSGSLFEVTYLWEGKTN